MRFATLTLVFCLIALVSVSATAAPVVVYSSFGSGDSFNTNTSWLIDGSSPPEYQAIASPFVVTGGSFSLDKIEVAVKSMASDPMVVYLRANTPGMLPGNVVESFTIPSDVMTTLQSGPAILSIDSVTHPVMVDGLYYWLAIEPGTSGTNARWHYSSPVMAVMVGYDLGTGWSKAGGVAPAYRVTATFVPVPEPTTLGLLGLGALALVGRARRHRAARRRG